jgi:serine/threonine protein kinase/class 3 adenylate cyclase
MEPIRIIAKNKRFVLQLVRNPDGTESLLKTLAEDHPSLDSQAQLQNEWRVAGKLNHEGIRRVLGESFHQNRKCLQLEYIEGENLLKRGPMDPGSFFRFSIQLTEALLYVHQQGIIHRDISSYNIMYNAVTNRYQLIDFGTAVSESDSAPPDSLIGTPAYSAPELTGRLQIKPDHRADLYSLGIIFYEMLTGGNPFRDSSDMQTIYRQIATQVDPPHEINATIPVSLSKIVMKLLAKDPDKRYENARSLLYDLEEVHLLFRRNVIATDFFPGSSEKPPPYNDSPALIGYDQEKGRLTRQFTSFLNGQSQLTWITGEKGTGKTSLVQSLLPRFYDEQVMYLNLGTGSGSAKPFALLYELFEAILQRIEEEPEEQLLKRKMRFSAGNISNVSFLVDKIPSLARFVSLKKIDQDHGSIQSQNRFQLALQELLQVLALPDIPVIAHFTNSDRIDPESVSFLTRFAKDVPEEFIWVIFESVEPGEISEPQHIHLTGLPPEKMEELFRQMIQGEVRTDEKIMDYVQTFGGSNPGKLINLVNYWYDHGFFEFDHKRKYWFWRNDSNRDLFPGTAASPPQINDPVEKDVLEWTSLLEGHFTLEMLDALSNYPADDLRNALQALNIKNYVQSIRNGTDTEKYKLTGRIDPDSLFPDPESKTTRHIAIARLLTKLDKDPYRQAFHINKTLEAGNRTFSGKPAVEINLQAGLKAKAEGAFQLAHDYFLRAKEELDPLLEPAKGTRFTLYLNLAELSALEGSHKTSAQLFENALKYASGPLEKAGVYSSQVVLHNHQGNHEASLNSGFKALETLGYPIPQKANRLLLARKLIRSWFRLHRKDPLELLKLPPIQDEKVILSLRIMENLHAALFNKSSELLLMVLLISMERILKYGNAPEGYSAYAGFGAVLALGFGNYKKGWAFTLAGAEMTNQFDNKFYQGRGLYAKGGWIINYVMHTRESIPVLETGIQLSRESGDFSYATNGYTNLQEAYFMTGTPLAKMEKEVDEVIAFTHQIGYRDILALSLTSKLYCMRLSNREEEFEEVLAKWFSGQDLADYTESSSFKHIRIYFLLLEAYWNYFSGRTEKGIENLKQSKSLLYTLQGPAIIVDYYVIRGLLNFEYYKKTRNKRSLKFFRNSLAKVKKYAKLVTENYGHRYYLLKALDLYLKNKHFAARNAMRKALVLARENEFLQIEGICSRYLADWFMETGEKDYARLHFRDGISVYSRWQSTFLLEKITADFEEFNPGPSDPASHSSSGSYSGHSGFSDPEVLMQSALNVASETDFEALLKVMNRIFVEQAGATRSLLFIHSDSNLRLLYAVDDGKDSFHPYPGKPVNQVNNIPLSILRLVQRTREAILINDTSREQRFRFEPYLRNTEPFSILVTPLLYRGELSGIIYFENRLLTQAFSEKRRELLKLLSGQFAVALQNARLVEELEHRVKERTTALESEKDRADLLLKNILPAETAEELKIKGIATSRYHEQVTVMFTDFIGFTKTSEKMHPEKLVKMLDYYFRAFDRIIKKYGLEKIKTIGDAYLCVSGLPVFHPKHALRAVQAAFEILEFVNSPESIALYGLEIRIGIHSGPVVAGVVGEEKFAFDIWGDTVNTASRMENNSQAGMVNISRETMSLVENDTKYRFTYRGKVRAKNKGEIDMYFIGENERSMPDHEAAIAMILDKMTKELSTELYYHSIEHTREIMENVEILGKAEGLNDEELRLLATAAAFHDSGFMFSPDEHEARSAKIAAEYLPKYGFNTEQIEQIQKMILATKIPQQPTDLPSKVLADADLYYLGTDSFFHTGNKLFEEFKKQDIVSNEKDWLSLQIRFLESHQYHTQTAISECEAQKQVHLARLKERLATL